MKVWVQQGVFLDLCDEAAEGLRRVIRFWQSKEWGDLFITSGSEGTHLPHSYHYTRRAFDTRPPPGGISEEDLGLLREKLGPRWIALYELEPPHIHFQCNWE